MGMKEMPEVLVRETGKIWAHTYELFKVKTYVPTATGLVDVVNYGFKAPYLVVFEEYEQSIDEAVNWAEMSGLADVARINGSSVVFVYPTSGSWETASPDIYASLIAETKIHQYFRDGIVTMKNRFTGEWGDNFIRGAIFRAYLYGFGKSADFIAKNYLKTIEGEYLWGPGEITPAVCILTNLSVVPNVERKDIPVVSIGNSAEINKAFCDCEHTLIEDDADLKEDFFRFVVKFKRWCGHLDIEADYEQIGVVEEPGYVVLKTSPDNSGDDKDTTEHKVGYVAYYNKGLFDNGPVPMMFAFHGGGDSTFYITQVSGWWRVAHKHNFLLIAIENHLDSTATEMVEMIGKLKERYNIDEKRIYASGFSMGGCKSWDCFQEYPNVFAALAPMDATFEVGTNSFGHPAPCEINRSVPVPVFYAGGEITPLPELPFQAQKCTDRIAYLFEVNRVTKKYDVSFEKQDNWENKIWGVNGDRTEKLRDESRDAVLTLQYFDSEDGVCRTVLASIDNQGHECREHTCEQAWLFMKNFTR